MSTAHYESKKDDGLVFCPNHPTILYDPKKYKQCFYCSFPNKCKNFEKCGNRCKAEYELCWDCANTKLIDK
jgi:hypothetical protein